MTTVPSHFQQLFHPLANEKAIVIEDKARFTCLTERLIRLEYDPQAVFEDRPSQAFWHRQQAVPDFVVRRDDAFIEIETGFLRLRYEGGPFTAVSLTIILKQSGVRWHYGQEDNNNLKGTARTLDGVSGSTWLEPGLLSRDGWVVVDDSKSLIFNQQGWLEGRGQENCLDLYFFGYGDAYMACLQAYGRLTGVAPLLPRWSLGNWWSRYWEYTQAELTDLMAQFQAYEIPLSVCIIDMDWHVTDVGEYEHVLGAFSGWTGYTWNKALFPDPDGLIRQLHEQGLKTALNLHPADGVLAHEAAYPEMAARLGVDAATNVPIPFDIARLDFALPYFEVLHHPEEARGIDFWWVDWQQGEESSLVGLDPLWWLNHLHFYDLGRDGRKRPFTFSRWGGLGNHRYPIGFSGDTVVDWSSLAFQPYFTATAANVAYSWWSHDVGGHMDGMEDPELYVRWVQYGVFSPIFRLHSTKNPFHERLPWGYNVEVFQLTRHAMQLRHALIPYLYSMVWLNHHQHVSPIRPLYHDYPQAEAAYYNPQAYTFGMELIAAPYTSPADANTNLSRQVIWLPPGDWYDFFTGEYKVGDSFYALYGRLADVPVFAKAGAIVPLGPEVGWGGLENPEQLTLHIFAGADNVFDLYEDDGETMAYKEGAYALTHIRQKWQSQMMCITVETSGDTQLIPEQRLYNFVIYGVQQPLIIDLEVDGISQTVISRYEAETEKLHIDGIELTPANRCQLILKTEEQSLLSRRNRLEESCLRLLWAFSLESQAKQAIASRLPALIEQPERLGDYALALTTSQMRALLEVIEEAGVHYMTNVGYKHLMLLWNNHNRSEVHYTYTRHRPVWDLAERFQSEHGIVPRFKVILPEYSWQTTVHYGYLANVVYAFLEEKKA